MNKKTNEELQDLVMKATSGDKEALEMLVTGVQDIIFNLSLRMLGTFADAEDATQDILLKMITHLSSFRGDSSFTTWVFSIAVNHLKNYKKHMFAHYPLSFEYYGEDIQNGKIQDVPDLTQNVEKDILAEELKMSCTNVMLQCLDTEGRCIFILGTMFKVVTMPPAAAQMMMKAVDFLLLVPYPSDLLYPYSRDTSTLQSTL